MDWLEAEKQLLAQVSIRRAAENVDLAYEIGKMVIDARIARHMTQKELAAAVGTRQPSIARLESGNSAPSLSFLQKIAQALETELLPPRFAFLEASYTYRSTVDVRFSVDATPVVRASRPRLEGAGHTLPTIEEILYANA